MNKQIIMRLSNDVTVYIKNIYELLSRSLFLTVHCDRESTVLRLKIFEPRRVLVIDYVLISGVKAIVLA